MRVSVLGATEVWRGDHGVDLGSRKPRALVAALSLYAGRPVSVDMLIDLLWSDSPSGTVAGTLQAYISACGGRLSAIGHRARRSRRCARSSQRERYAF